MSVPAEVQTAELEASTLLLRNLQTWMAVVGQTLCRVFCIISLALQSIPLEQRMRVCLLAGLFVGFADG